MSEKCQDRTCWHLEQGDAAAVTLAPVTCRSENSELVDLHRRRPAQHLPGDIARHAALARGRGVLVDG
jgi:hypothetical protein